MRGTLAHVCLSLAIARGAFVAAPCRTCTSVPRVSAARAAAEEDSSEEPGAVGIAEETTKVQDPYEEPERDLVAILTQTPLGPFVGINLLFWATDFSWCNTPFVEPDSKACIESIARDKAEREAATPFGQVSELFPAD